MPLLGKGLAGIVERMPPLPNKKPAAAGLVTPVASWLIRQPCVGVAYSRWRIFRYQWFGEAMHAFDRYIPRPIEFIDQVNLEGWRIKVYGISATSLPLPEGFVSGALGNVLSHLPKPAVTKQRYGVGFLIIHRGTMRNWILLDWWEKEDIIHHKLFSSPLDKPSAITAEADNSLIACVHELRVITFESEAWIKTVLGRDDNPDFEKYLELRFNSEC